MSCVYIYIYIYIDYHHKKPQRYTIIFIKLMADRKNKTQNSNLVNAMFRRLHIRYLVTQRYNL